MKKVHKQYHKSLKNLQALDKKCQFFLNSAPQLGVSKFCSYEGQKGNKMTKIKTKNYLQKKHLVKIKTLEENKSL